MKTVLITGQSGSYLTYLLLKKGYKFYGLVRRASKSIMVNIEFIKNQVEWMKIISI
ncbi:GDP-mannose 4,6-dehydratase [Psychrobacillus soli]|uniref:NAD(P)-binding domain-containing protein n=1 Tax=Psychrobacillus soli TaxID=1543965 RepID=A0A544TL27_9BACI|nr:GDP-mannose 4,6-dehydratase [Psychrobacillus soli]TQR18154.1 hypothetical protein FG383_03110 [Psychrobacillus soli]